MRILFSLTYYTPYISGLTICVARIAEELSKDYPITVLTMQHNPTLKLLENGKVRIVRALPILKISKGFFSLEWIAKSFIEVRNSDVVVVNLPQMEGVVPALFAKIMGKKLLTIYHCDVKLPSGVFNSFVQWCLNLSNHMVLSLSDKIVTYTEDYGKNTKILKKYLKKSKYIYPPIIKPEINKRIQKSIVEKIGKDKPLVVGIAARLAAEKGIEYVLEAIPYLGAKTKIIIAGPLNPVGEEKYKKKILSLVEKYNDQVIFLDSIQPNEMGSFYSMIDVLFLSSINSTEAFGMVQVEAMMYGVPVVATDLPGVRTPVQETGMGVVVPIKNPYELASATVQIMKNKAKYTKMFSQIEKIFSYSDSISTYKEVIKNL